MAVGTPYGRFAYGSGPYARAVGRPYGVGPYGVGLYERFQGNTFDVAGATAIAFHVTAEPTIVLEMVASTSVTFSVSTIGPQISMYPWAITEIVFNVWTEHAAVSWDAWTPCEVGAWSPAAPCEGGLWAPPAPCSSGAWQTVRLA